MTGIGINRTVLMRFLASASRRMQNIRMCCVSSAACAGKHASIYSVAAGYDGLSPGLFSNVDIEPELLARLDIFSLDAVPAMQVGNTDTVSTGYSR